MCVRRILPQRHHPLSNCSSGTDPAIGIPSCTIACAYAVDMERSMCRLQSILETEARGFARSIRCPVSDPHWSCRQNFFYRYYECVVLAHVIRLR